MTADKTMLAVLKRYGLKPSTFAAPPEPQVVRLEEWAADDKEPRELVESLTGGKHASAKLLQLAEEDEALKPYLSDMPAPDVEIGTPGTPIYGGILRVDPSYRMSPFVARGHASSLGVYEEHLREPLVYQCFQTLRQLLVTGSWTIQMPELAQEWMTPAQLGALEREIDTIWSALLNTEDGWDHYVEHAATAIIFGFSIFEVVWRQTSKGWLPSRLAFREASTVDQWLMTARQDRLVGVRFATGSPGSTYVLPAWGDTLTSRRVLLNTLGGRGNNFEGIPPTRPIDTLITYKKLLLTIAAAAAERFGSPVLLAKVDAGLKDLPGFNPSQEQWDGFMAILETMRALETPTLAAPPGLDAAYLGPPGTMPDLLGQLEYCDKQIMLAFSNQGSLLGQGAHGSYALAEVQDNQLLRSAPYYAQVITRSLNGLIRDLLRSRGWTLPQYPQIKWQVGGAADASRLLADLGSFMSQAGSWPRAAQQLGLKLMGLPADTFEAGDAFDPQDDQRQAAAAADAPTLNAEHGAGCGCGDALTALAESYTPPKGVQDNAARALAVREDKVESERGMTPVGIARARDLSNGRPVSEDTLRRMVAYFDRHESDKQGETWDEQGKGWQAWHGWGGDEGWRWAKQIVERLDRERDELADALAQGELVQLAESDWPPAAAALMDAAEAELAKAFGQIQRAQQQRWRELIRDNTDAADLLADRDQIRREYQPRYLEAVQLVIEQVGERAGVQLGKQLGVELGIPFEVTPELSLLAANVADEMTSRTIGLMSSAQVERERGSSRLAVPILATATLTLIASRAVSGAFNAGRDRMIQSVLEAFKKRTEQTPRFIAERSAVLDPATCETCAALDGVQVLVGSKRYRDLSPPNRCKGGERCRCVWIYRVPAGIADVLKVET
jgi:hypothetical protein